MRQAPSIAAAAAAVLLISPPAWAQGVISSGGTFLRFVGTPFGTASGNGSFYFGSGNEFNNDQLFRLGWSYNQGVGTSNRPFSSLDTPVASYVGNTATFTWTNAGAGTTGFARWNATMTVTLTEIAPAPGSTATGAARVDTALTFTANAANSGSIAYSIFNDIDVDLIGTGGNAANDVYSVVNPNGVLVRATDTAGINAAEFLAPGAARYQLATGSTLRALVGASGTGSGNLSTLAGTSVADWASTDGAVAFQWNATLAPGQSTTIASSFALNAPAAAVPEPAAWALLAGGLGLLAWQGRRRVAGAKGA